MCEVTQHAPLTWPDAKLKSASGGTKARKAWRAMMRQVHARGPIPAEVWGADPRRYHVASEIAEIIKTAIGWDDTNFIPDDPFDILLWGSWYDFAEVEAFMQIEIDFGIEVPWEEKERLFNSTFGQVVDYVIETGVCPRVWPKKGEDSLESRRCPSMAAFYDLRAFVQESCGAGDLELHPSTNLPLALNKEDLARTTAYVRRRFGVNDFLFLYVFGLLPLPSCWVVLSVAASVLICATLPWHPFLLALGCVVLWVVLGLVASMLSRPNWPMRLRTVRGLIKWLLSQREAAPA